MYEILFEPRRVGDPLGVLYERISVLHYYCCVVCAIQRSLTKMITSIGLDTNRYCLPVALTVNGSVRKYKFSLSGLWLQRCRLLVRVPRVAHAADRYVTTKDNQEQLEKSQVGIIRSRICTFFFVLVSSMYGMFFGTFTDGLRT